MTVSSENRRKDYAGDGASTVFPTTFRFLANEDLKVIKTIIATSVEEVLVLDSDYSVSGAGETSGTVTLNAVLESTEKLTILRDAALTQNIDYIENDPFPSQSHENGLDRLTMLVQQLQEEIDRSIKLTESQQSSGLSIPAPEVTKFLQWDEDGNLINVDISTLGNVVLTTFGQTLINSIDAEAARLVMESAALESPTFTGAPLAPTPTNGDNSTKIATTAFVQSLVGVDKPQWTTLSVGTDSDHDIDFSAGSQFDSTGSVVISGSALTKQLDFTWAAGDAAGGRFPGVSLTADTAYACFTIRKDSDGSVDYGFDTDSSAANIPSGYTAYKRLLWILTDSSANIIGFYQHGDYVTFDSSQTDVNTTNPTTSAVTPVMSIPPKTIGRLQVLFQNSVNSHVLLTETSQTNVAADSNNFTVRSNAASEIEVVHLDLYAGSGRSIRYRSDDANVDLLKIITKGFIDQRIN